jgi:ABC-type multidrug transport system ATPase subunit
MVRHRDSVAVDGVDVSLASGEQLVVLGSSGAGKTTLLHSLLGAGPRVQGDVSVGDLDPYDPTHRRSVRRNTGIILQGGDLVPRMRAHCRRLGVQPPVRPVRVVGARPGTRASAVA